MRTFSVTIALFTAAFVFQGAAPAAHAQEAASQSDAAQQAAEATPLPAPPKPRSLDQLLEMVADGFETERALYATSPDAALDRIRELDDAVASVLLVGHEPTWSSLASQLIGDAGLRFPTGALARIDLSAVSWPEVDAGNGVLVWFVTPRLLARALPEE